MAHQPTDSRPLVEGPGLLQSVRQHWLLAGVIMAVCALIGFGLAASTDPTYTSTAKVGLATPPNVGGPTGMVRYAETMAQFARSNRVMTPSAKKIGGISASELRGVIDTAADQAANIIYITASAATPAASVERADAVMESLQNEIKADIDATRKDKATQIETKRKAQNAILTDARTNASQKAAAQQVLQRLEDQEITLDAEAADFGDGVVFVQGGLTPLEPGIKAAATQGVLGGVVGFIIAMVACWIIADRRRIIDDAAVPGIITDARLLGEVPTLRGGAARALSTFAEMPSTHYEFAAAGLWSGIESGIVLVSGVERGAGSTTTAANVAAAFARDGRRVALIDADGTDRSLTDIAGIPKGTPGLSDVLSMRAPVEDALRAVDLGDAASVAVLPIGRPEPDLASLLRGKPMHELTERLREWYDIVIIDIPPIATEAHGASLARIVDGVVFVVPRNVRLRRIERLRERLDLLHFPVLGYVFTRDHALDASNRSRIGARLS